MSYTFIEGGVCAPQGFKAGGLHCGIRKNKSKKDLCLLYSVVPCAAAGVYTQNKVCGAPVTLTKRHLQNGTAQAMVCNSGNANTCNADGIKIATEMAALVSKALQVPAEDVVIASTGVIGQKLDIAPIAWGIETLAPQLSFTGNQDAADAIMTTDTVRKEAAVTFTLSGKVCHIGCMAKGSGMIEPNMATLLSFATTDVAISPALLQKALKIVADLGYNMVSVDGDTSTNDTFVILANGLAGNPIIDQENDEYDQFVEAFTALGIAMARKIAGDGEGATKLLECVVEGAPDYHTAKVIAKSVINSSLVKTAMYGADANWGRELCAIGYAPVDIDASKIDLTFSSAAGTLLVCHNGVGAEPAEGGDAVSGLDEAFATKILSEKEIQILIGLQQGEARAVAWGCDLTYDYVKINGDYRT